MSEFAVEVKELGGVWPHPNADRLDIAEVRGMDFQFIIGKGSHRVGDKVVYFPVDAVLPDDLIEFVGMTGKFAGTHHNRVKTVRLRGEISQGFATGAGEISEYLGKDAEGLEDLTEALQVTKYEPPDIPCLCGTLVPLIDGVSVYDIEGTERNPEIVEALMDLPVVVTEKLEGSNCHITDDRNNQIQIGQRRNNIVESPGQEHMIGRAFREQGLDKLVTKIKQDGHFSQVTLRGELIGPGVQKNIYGLPHRCIRVFDVLCDVKYVDPDELAALVPEEHRVPILWDAGTLREFLDGKTPDEASAGRTVLPNNTTGCRREGIVIVPKQVFRIRGFGRAILKKRSSDYLYRANE